MTVARHGTQLVSAMNGLTVILWVESPLKPFCLHNKSFLSQPADIPKDVHASLCEAVSQI